MQVGQVQTTRNRSKSPSQSLEFVFFASLKLACLLQSVASLGQSSYAFLLWVGSPFKMDCKIKLRPCYLSGREVRAALSKTQSDRAPSIICQALPCRASLFFLPARFPTLRTGSKSGQEFPLMSGEVTFDWHSHRLWLRPGAREMSLFGTTRFINI